MATVNRSTDSVVLTILSSRSASTLLFMFHVKHADTLAQGRVGVPDPVSTKRFPSTATLGKSPEILLEVPTPFTFPVKYSTEPKDSVSAIEHTGRDALIGRYAYLLDGLRSVQSRSGR